MSIGPGILTLTIREQGALRQAYMNFIQGGGLFVPTQREYALGDEVFMILSLLDDGEKLPVAGRIVWITPKGAQGGRLPGIGVQFSDQDNGKVRSRIETALAGMLKSDRPTHTL
ncbi:pilus assembly protein PilZ [Acidihalobacter ferrooxydans]|uniref:Pilus assembly protein PilZ n=2 Tax=Acidihalobacter ferrooxydans TaxID=1765967 RepID=A0A1P8UII0_9GAMM|nr:PilZ domain-containing protein [Acidihalobacter ferrooxydans]APZ43643.1 pilus assembly protein PilZ [Acidihalobacter ferrooxydans]